MSETSLAPVAPKPAGEGMVQRAEASRAVTPPARSWMILAGALPPAVLRRRKFFSLKLVGFVVLVALPTLLAAAFYGFVASSQFVAETRFGVRSGETGKNDATAIFQGAASASQIGLDSSVVVQYAQSREIVDELEKSIGLRQIFSRPEIDWFDRLDPNVSAEEVVDYWRRRIDPYFDLTTGSISVRVKAFTPVDAQKLASEVLRLSEALVNRMSRRARNDTVQLAKDEVALAEQRLQNARSAILAYRNKERVLDGQKQADSSLAMISRMKEGLAKLNAELSSVQSYLSDTAPTVKALRNRGQEEQLALAEAQLTPAQTPGTSIALSQTLDSFDMLETERKLAEKYYEATLDSLQKSQVNANRQATYLQAFVQPSLPERALFPKRLEATGLTLLAGLGVWILAMLAVVSIRDHS